MPINITDPYQLRELIDEKKRDLIPEEDDETLELGMYGVMSSIASNMIAMTVKTAATKANEVFPTRAKFKSSIITHSATNGINIMSTPANIDVLLCFNKEEIEYLFSKNERDLDPVIIDSEAKFLIGEYEYHLDYPLLIYKKVLNNKKVVYTAQYDMSITNPTSTISNPYLQAPYIIRNSGFDYIFISCRLSQVFIDNKYNKLTSNVAITNKTYIVKFDHQMAALQVIIKDGDNTYYLTPVCEGNSIDDDLSYYCWYNYLDSNTLRIRFDDASYMPTINAEVTTRIYETLGDTCNFKYNKENIILTTLEDTENYKYNSMAVQIIPQSNSKDGRDSRSVAELKAILPKEALARKSIVKRKDLENYFVSLNTDNIRALPSQKVDNQAIRCHYLYLLMKDKKETIVPMNTLPVYLEDTNFDQIVEIGSDKQYILKQGKILGYNHDDLHAKIISKEDINNYDFVYTIPFKLIVNSRGPSISYYMTAMNENYELEYNYVNAGSPLQFIVANSIWKRAYSDEGNATYSLMFRAIQNADIDFGITQDDIMAIVILYNDEGQPFRYFKSKCNTASTSDGRYYDLEVVFETNDVIDENNNIRINNGYAVGQDTIQYGYLPKNAKADIYLLAKISDPVSHVVSSYGISESGLDNYVRNHLDPSYTCTNIYKVAGGVDFFVNFSEVMNTVVKASSEEKIDGGYKTYFNLNLVPLLGYEYGTDNELLMEFIEKIKMQKIYMDNAIEVLEGGTAIDFKFYNTYGASRLYKLDKEGNTHLDRVNLSITMDVNLKKLSDTYTPGYIEKYIKDTIDNLDKTGDMHLPVLVSDINGNYNASIYYAECTGINEYGNTYMHFYKTKEENVGDIPEFLNINRLPDGSPDITINIIE